MYFPNVNTSVQVSLTTELDFVSSREFIVLFALAPNSNYASGLIARNPYMALAALTLALGFYDMRFGVYSYSWDRSRTSSVVANNIDGI